MKLTENEIIENSKLISEFMGLNVKKVMLSYNLYNQRGYRILKWGMNSEENLWIQLNKNNFYHSSWEWLMPVIEKIEDLKNLKDDKCYYSVNINYCQTERINYEIENHPYFMALENNEEPLVDSPKIYKSEHWFIVNKIGEYSINEGSIVACKSDVKFIAIYNGVVEFIKWYNFKI